MQQVDIDSHGAKCTYNGTTIRLDPRTAGDEINFVSHAHTDHLPSSSRGCMLASEPTALLARARGRDLGEYMEGTGGLKLYDSGHMLGARGLLAGDVFYTGDICTRPRGFLGGARVPRCRTIITECTFGLPEFSFPPIHEIKSRVDEIISMMYSRGIPVILMGYEVGKAQTLSHMFAHWKPIYYHDSVRRINQIHRELGVPLPDAPGHSQAEAAGLLRKTPWVMIAPMLGVKSEFLRNMRKYGAVTIGFSGWANSARTGHSRGADYTMPLSDHCDFNDLVSMVERSGAEQAYTVHGFVREFAQSLQERGISARPLDAAAAPH